MIFNWLSVFIGIAYIALGIFVVSTRFFVVQLETKIAYIFAVLLMVYGGFRVIRAFSRMKKRKE